MTMTPRTSQWYEEIHWRIADQCQGVPVELLYAPEVKAAMITFIKSSLDLFEGTFAECVHAPYQSTQKPPERTGIWLHHAIRHHLREEMGYRGYHERKVMTDAYFSTILKETLCAIDEPGNEILQQNGGVEGIRRLGELGLIQTLDDWRVPKPNSRIHRPVPHTGRA